jgi:hypothetical protein
LARQWSYPAKKEIQYTTLKPLLKFSTTLIVWKLASTTERFILKKYSWFVIPDHRWSLQKHHIRSLDESKSNISPLVQGLDSETKSQKQARERRNKMK